MKKTSNILLLAFAFTACTNPIEEYNDWNAETESLNLKSDYSVKYADVLTLSQSQNAASGASTRSLEIECITNESNDTLLYVCEKPDGGWVIYSSDTRTPAVVANSDEGSFESLKQIDGARLWIQSMAEDLAAIKRLPDDKLNFTPKEIENNKAFWKSISSPDKYIKEKLKAQTRDAELLITGHYELRYSTSFTEVYDSISRLTETNWSQGSPYNNYCPYKSNSTTDHAPAGCVAIAAAQMLYYLHDYYGVPETAPSEAYCYGDINSYTWAQTNYTTEIWEEMALSGAAAAPLIADVGRRVNMNYGDNSSGAQPSNLVGNVFAPYGISCTYATYDVTPLKNNLLDSIPVILIAYSTEETDKVGHAFIADRYKRTRIVTENYYEWVYDAPSDKPLLSVPEKIEYTYASPVISMIGMNWGWGRSYNISTDWYSLTGDWTISTYNWNINRSMVYDFKVK